MLEKNSRKIMLVEDDRLIVLAEAKVIESFGYEVVSAFNGQEALRVVQEVPEIGLILMDIDLGQGPNGVELARTILSDRSLPIIFLTSFTGPEMAERVRDIAHYGYVLKTSDGYLLKSAIDMAFRLFDVRETARENENRYRDLYNSAQRQAQEMALLDLVRGEIASDLDLPSVIRNTVEGIARSFGYSLVSLYLLRGDVLVLQHQVGYEHVLQEIPISLGVSGKVVRTGQPVFLQSALDDTDFLAAVPGIVAEICVPLFDRGQVVGTLNIECKPGMDLSKADLRLMISLSSHISIAIGRARLYSAVRESEERFRLLFHQAPYGWFQYDHDLRLDEINERGHTILEIEPGSIAAQTMHDLVDARILPVLEKALAGEEGQYEGIYQVKSGEQPKWVLIKAAPLLNEQEEVRAGMAVVQDISERVRAVQTQKTHDEQMSALYATSLELNAQSNLSQLLEAIVRRAAMLLKAPVGGLYLMDADGVGLQLAAGFNLKAEFQYNGQTSPGRLAEKIAETGKPMTGQVKFEGTGSESELANVRILGVPMRWGEKILGVIVAQDHRRADEFQDDEIMLLSLFAEQAVIAIQNTRLLAESNRRGEELAALNRIGQAVNSNLELRDMLRTLYEECRQIFPLDVFYVAVYDENTGKISMPLLVDKEQLLQVSARNIFVNPGLTGEVILGRRTIYLSDLERESGHGGHQIFVSGDGPSLSYVGVPLIVKEKVIGVLSIQSYTMAAYQPDQIRLLETIADQVAVAINHAHLYARVQENSRYLMMLNEITTAALQSSDLHHMMQTIAEKLGSLLGADSCHITLWDATQASPIPTAAFGEKRDEYSNEKPVKGEVTLTESVLKAGHPLVIEDLQHSAYISPVIAQMYPDVRSVLALPLMAADQPLGAAMVGFNSAHAFSEEEIARGAQAADQIALATAKLQLANTDPLTGLYNRRGLFEVGKREIERFHRYNSPLSVILLDIDHFKRVNDQYSHAIGDQVLVAVVEMCRRNIRAVDSFGRYGGEEFALLLPETDINAAQQLAQRLCVSIAGMPIHTALGPISVTVSIGVTCINRETHNLDMLINRADDAMYAAKRAGRNRVMTFVD